MNKLSNNFLDTWEECFNTVLDAVFECLEEEQIQVKEFSLIVLKEFILTQPRMFDPILENTLQRLIEHYNDERQLSQGADEVLEALGSTQQPVKLLNLLCSLILKEEPPTLQALIRLEI
jgi:hypothetical protein